MSRHLPVLAILVLSVPIYTQAQSLGDAAREYRAAKQQSVPRHNRVITNNDISGPQLEDTDLSQASSNDAENVSKAPNTEEREAQDGTQKRTAEVNQRYLDRIDALRDQINTAQLQLGKLRADQLDNVNEFRKNAGTSPDAQAAYEKQQSVYTEQIEALRNLIANLKSRLEDAQEAARRAGVPHAAYER